MTREEAIAKLIEYQSRWDTEYAHPDADDILCGLLVGLGYSDVVAEYSKIERWFA